MLVCQACGSFLRSSANHCVSCSAVVSSFSPTSLQVMSVQSQPLAMNVYPDPLILERAVSQRNFSVTLEKYQTPGSIDSPGNKTSGSSGNGNGNGNGNGHGNGNGGNTASSLEENPGFETSIQGYPNLANQAAETYNSNSQVESLSSPAAANILAGAVEKSPIEQTATPVLPSVSNDVVVPEPSADVVEHSRQPNTEPLLQEKATVVPQATAANATPVDVPDTPFSAVDASASAFFNSNTRASRESNLDFEPGVSADSANSASPQNTSGDQTEKSEYQSAPKPAKRTNNSAPLDFFTATAYEPERAKAEKKLSNKETLPTMSLNRNQRKSAKQKLVSVLIRKISMRRPL